jgi:formylglycine-generating enzyme required for sulfatase activity/Tol biopolymer transport system component
MICPDDTFNRRDNFYRYLDREGTKSVFARGNYAINGGTHLLARMPGASSAPAPDGYEYHVDRQSGVFAWFGSGIAGFNKAFRPEEFENGLATLVAVEEVRSGIHPIDPRGCWALGQIAASVTWGHGVTGDDYGPNNTSPRADDILGGPKLHKLFGEQALIDAKMPCVSYWDINHQATSRSLHPGGVQMAMADGAVRFVSDEIDPGVWHVMHSRHCPRELLSESKLSQTRASSDAAGWLGAVGAEDGVTEAEGLPVRIANSVGMELALVRPAAFTMGMPDQKVTDVPPECPAHLVRITRPFYMGVFEVTQGQYQRLMGTNPSWHTSGREGKGTAHGGTDRLPVEQVRCDDAAEFCRRLSESPDEKAAGLVYRLPSEAEWEYGCRGGSNEAYAWKSEPDLESGDNAGTQKSGSLEITAVGSYPPNRLGVCDLRGNVYEWCGDWFERDYYARSPLNDPRGPAGGWLRAVRGSDWLFAGEGCLVNRRIAAPWQSNRYLGFRVVAEVVGGFESLKALAGDGDSEVQVHAPGQLAICSAHRNRSQSELVLFDSRRRTAALMTSEWATTPAWDPSGQRLAYVDGKDLYVRDVSRGTPLNLTKGRFSVVVTPNWLSDGSGILYSCKEGEHWSLRCAALEGGDDRLLKGDSLDHRFPACSPDGTTILCTSSVADAWPAAGLFSFALDGRDERKLFAESVPFNASPAWSPDGARFVFANWGKTSLNRQLVIATRQGEIVDTLTGGNGYACYPAWSPDGSFIAYVEFHRDPSTDGAEGDLMLYDLSARTSAVLSTGTLPRWEHGRPAWKPLGRQVSIRGKLKALAVESDPEIRVQAPGQLAICSAHRNPWRFELVLFDSRRRTAGLVASEWATTPAWAPSGQRLAYVDGKDLYVRGESREPPLNLTNGRFVAVAAPNWLADGNGILYSCKEGEHWSIRRVALEGGDDRLLKGDALDRRFPACSPDGTTILITSGVSEEWPATGLISFTLDGRDERKLFAESVPFNASPAWSPDGARFVFANWGKAWLNRQLVIATRHGEIVDTLTSGDGYACYPAWSPDGRFIAYVEFHRDPSTDGAEGDLMLYDLSSRISTALSSGVLPSWEHGRPAWRSAGRQTFTRGDVAGSR